MTEPLADHPAKWSKPVLEQVVEIVTNFGETLGMTTDVPIDLLDPFAGTGGIHVLSADLRIRTTGVELEPEWAANESATIVGDASALPAEWTDSFDVVATSPCFGNRMADHHEAADPCKPCAGTGWLVTNAGDLNEARERCEACGGRGLSRRNTYRHTLGRQLSDNSAAAMQWGEQYRTFHEQVVAEWERVLRPAGVAVVNMKNHLRKGRRSGEAREQRVIEWWVNMMIVRGWGMVGVRRVRAAGNRYGTNGGARIDSEVLIVMRRPDYGS